MGDKAATESAKQGKPNERVVKNFDARMKTLKTAAPRVKLMPGDLQDVFIEVDIDKDTPLTDCATSTGAKANLILSNSYDQNWKPTPHKKKELEPEDLELQKKIAEVLASIPKKEYPPLNQNQTS